MNYVSLHDIYIYWCTPLRSRWLLPAPCACAGSPAQICAVCCSVRCAPGAARGGDPARGSERGRHADGESLSGILEHIPPKTVAIGRGGGDGRDETDLSDNLSHFHFLFFGKSINHFRQKYRFFPLFIFRPPRLVHVCASCVNSAHRGERTAVVIQTANLIEFKRKLVHRTTGGLLHSD